GAPPPPAEYAFIDAEPGLDEAPSALDAAAGPIGVDGERASGSRCSERAFLVQLRAASGPALLVDPETPGRTVGPLSHSLSPRRLLLHAASQDLPSLREL